LRHGRGRECVATGPDIGSVGDLGWCRVHCDRPGLHAGREWPGSRPVARPGRAWRASRSAQRSYVVAGPALWPQSHRPFERRQRSCARRPRCCRPEVGHGPRVPCRLRDRRCLRLRRCRPSVDRHRYGRWRLRRRSAASVPPLVAFQPGLQPAIGPPLLAVWLARLPVASPRRLLAGPSAVPLAARRASPLVASPPGQLAASHLSRLVASAAGTAGGSPRTRLMAWPLADWRVSLLVASSPDMLAASPTERLAAKRGLTPKARASVRVRAIRTQQP